MGFRCPNCRQDFGNKKEDLDNHLHQSKDCSSEAHFALVKTEFIANVDVPKKKRKLVYTSKGLYKGLDIRKNNIKREATFIGDHDWKKTNIVSKHDGSDNVVCRKCGLKAKRNFSTLTFSANVSANKIENCNLGKYL